MKQKNNTSYRCTNCQHMSIKWIGCCPTCSEWNSFIEAATSSFSKKQFITATPTTFVSLATVDDKHQQRMLSGITTWDHVIGGGIVKGSFLILVGDPGIGKSTLLLQIASKLAGQYSVAYVSSEESLHQVKQRALRLKVNTDQVLFSDQSCLEEMLLAARTHRPDLLILDSIQNCSLASESAAIPGTVAQLREAGFRLMQFAKEQNIAVLVTGHITKEGNMAGPKILEHMVDGVFYLQAEDRWQTRMLRSVKNRFGATDEIGFFNMQESGLTEIADINKQLLAEYAQAPGSVLTCSMEGTQPLLLEMQALVVPAKFGVAQRVVTGLDQKRVVLIAAILEKYLHIPFGNNDIFFKIGSGFRTKESAGDLGIALALLSSYFQKALPTKSLAAAEINLTGHIKPTNHISATIKEAEKFGLQTVFIAQQQKLKNSNCSLHCLKSVYDLLSLFPED